MTAKPRNHQVYLPPATERLGVTCSSVGVESAGYGLSIVTADQEQDIQTPSRFDGTARVTSDWFLAYMITGTGQPLRGSLSQTRSPVARRKTMTW